MEDKVKLLNKCISEQQGVLMDGKVILPISLDYETLFYYQDLQQTVVNITNHTFKEIIDEK